MHVGMGESWKSPELKNRFPGNSLKYSGGIFPACGERIPNCACKMTKHMPGIMQSRAHGDHAHTHEAVKHLQVSIYFPDSGKPYPCSFKLICWDPDISSFLACTSVFLHTSYWGKLLSPAREAHREQSRIPYHFAEIPGKHQYTFLVWGDPMFPGSWHVRFPLNNFAGCQGPTLILFHSLAHTHTHTHTLMAPLMRRR